MRWSTYTNRDGDTRAAVWRDGRLHPAPAGVGLVDLLGDDGTRLRTAADAALAGPGVDPALVTLLAPIARPPSIRDFMAFEEHVVTASAALGRTVDPIWYRQPVFYFTNPNALRGAHEPVPIAPGSAAFDYELEIAAVIGREGADLSPEQAVEHIAGYVLFCDWSARDLQGAEMTIGLGPAKGKDSASSCGPWMLTADELPAAAGHERLGQREALQRRQARHPLLELRRDDRVRRARHPRRAGRPHRLGHRRHRLHPRALPGARRRRVPLAERRGPGASGSRRPGRHRHPRRRGTRGDPPPEGRPGSSAHAHEITTPGPPRTGGGAGRRSTPTSSPTAPGGSTTPASWWARRASSRRLLLHRAAHAGLPRQPSRR